jgi:hypothetical protein
LIILIMLGEEYNLFSKPYPLKYETQAACTNSCVVLETMVGQRIFYLWILHDIAIGNVLDSPGSVPVKRIFSDSSRPTLSSIQFSTQWVLGTLSAGGKKVEAWWPLVFI